MGFDLFNQEDPREWTRQQLEGQFEEFRDNEVVGPHCERCQYDPQPVVKRGTIEADLMVVGDYTAPADQKTEKPFSGPAGDLLEQMLEGIDRDWETDCYVTNALLCDGTDEPPRKASVEACYENLSRQLDIVTPEVVLAMGKYAAQSLLQLNASDSLTDHLGHQGSPVDYPWMDLVVTFNPAYLLRLDDGSKKKQAVKQQVWDHLKSVRRRLEASHESDDSSS
jgi:uracil-DNA glycosylase family 4